VQRIDFQPVILELIKRFVGAPLKGNADFTNVKSDLLYVTQDILFRNALITSKGSGNYV
jgi:hypothetical protein